MCVCNMNHILIHKDIVVEEQSVGWPGEIDSKLDRESHANFMGGR